MSKFIIINDSKGEVVEDCETKEDIDDAVHDAAMDTGAEELLVYKLYARVKPIEIDVVKEED